MTTRPTFIYRCIAQFIFDHFQPLRTRQPRWLLKIPIQLILLGPRSYEYGLDNFKGIQRHTKLKLIQIILTEYHSYSSYDMQLYVQNIAHNAWWEFTRLPLATKDLIHMWHWLLMTIFEFVYCHMKPLTCSSIDNWSFLAWLTDQNPNHATTISEAIKVIVFRRRS